jgi:uncharacterized protein (DUF1330 family)
MTAYVIIDMNITEPLRYEEYKTLAGPTLELYGGKYLAHGGMTEILEGSWAPGHLVILQFDSVEQAKDWLNSTEYHEPRRLRHEAAVSNMVVIEGV